MKTFACLTVAVVCLSCASSITSASPEVHYTFTTIDFPAPGIVGQGATAINDRGQVIGDWEVGTLARGYLYEGGDFKSVDVSSQGGIIRGINSRDEASGFFSDDRGLHGFLFDLHQNNRIDIDVPSADLTEAAGLNDRGEVVGDYRDAETGAFHGFLRSAAGFFHQLDFPGATGMGPTGINNLGQIVGTYDLNNDPVGNRHAFLYENGQFRTIDISRPGARVTNPMAINDNGEIAGIYTDGAGNHGFVFDGSVFTIIDFHLKGVILTEIWGINNSGTIVGRYLDSAQVSHGFFATRSDF